MTWSVRNKSALAFLLVGTLFTLGAKLTETPITVMFRLIDGPGPNGSKRQYLILLRPRHLLGTIYLGGGWGLTKKR